jgi:hypothetical protein
MTTLLFKIPRRAIPIKPIPKPSPDLRSERARDHRRERGPRGRAQHRQ